MQELTLGAFIAVFEEMFGAWLWWLMVIMIIVVIAAFFTTMIKYKRTDSKSFFWAKIGAPFGGLAAILFIQAITNSGFSDIGGPLDVIVVALIATGGAIATMILAYLAQARWDWSKGNL